MVTSIRLFFIVDTLEHFLYNIEQYNAYYIKNHNFSQPKFEESTGLLDRKVV